MKIGINENFEIKQVENITDATLKKIEIDKPKIFGNQSNDMILCYCYKTANDEISTPFQSKDKFAEWEKLRLQQENEILKTQLALQNTAIDEIFIMLPTLGV